MIKQRAAALAVALAMLAAACSGVGGGSGVGTPAPTNVPGTLRIASAEEVQGLNPLLRAQPGGSDLDLLVFGFFFNLDDRMRLVPELATAVPTYANGGISRDGLTLTYQLRRGVKWQDGAPFTSRDVVFTAGAILNAKNHVVNRVGWDDIADVAAAGDYAVRFRLKKIYAPAVSTFFCEGGLYPVLPAHLLERYPDLNRVPFNDRPVGTGPFTIVRWVPGDRIELAANPEYWRGPPKLGRIVIKFAADSDAAAQQLETHAVDAWLQVPSDLYERVKGIPGIRMQFAPSLSYAHLDLNQKNPIFNDVRVRQAINYAIDKRSIIEGTLDGLATPAFADISPLSWAYDANVARYAYNPSEARSLLDAAGWRSESDGVRRKEGKMLSFSISAVDGAATARAIEDAISRQLREVGIDARVKNYPRADFFASFEDGGILYRGAYDAALFSWVGGVDPDDSSEYMCDEIPPAAGQNDLYWCDDTLDAAERGALSTYDRTVRKKYYAITQSQLASQSVSIFLFFSRQVFAVSPNLHGFRPAPAVSSTWNAWEWSI